MIKLNDYLYSGDTVLKILHRYAYDLKQDALQEKNPIGLAHCGFLMQIIDLLEHNDFLTHQSQRIREFYLYMAKEYPHLAFTFKGRIKSLIRSEEKFNGYIVGYITDYYKKNGCFPSSEEIAGHITLFRDLIAYRIVISVPRCHIGPNESKKETELSYLYEIANALPEFMEKRGFSVIPANSSRHPASSQLFRENASLYRDYVEYPRASGYQSLHITFYDVSAKCNLEVQLRTKDMDDFAEIGDANHRTYEQDQENRRVSDLIPAGLNRDYDEAYIRCRDLQKLDLSTIDVNMFGAINNHLINDGCGLYRGRLILPYEHLSRFQNDMKA